MVLRTAALRRKVAFEVRPAPGDWCDHWCRRQAGGIPSSGPSSFARASTTSDRRRASSLVASRIVAADDLYEDVVVKHAGHHVAANSSATQCTRKCRREANGVQLGVDGQRDPCGTKPDRHPAAVAMLSSTTTVHPSGSRIVATGCSVSTAKSVATTANTYAPGCLIGAMVRRRAASASSVVGMGLGRQKYVGTRRCPMRLA